MVHITDTRSQKVVSASATKVWRGYLHRLRDRVAFEKVRLMSRSSEENPEGYQIFSWFSSKRIGCEVTKQIVWQQAIYTVFFYVSRQISVDSCVRN